MELPGTGCGYAQTIISASANTARKGRAWSAGAGLRGPVRGGRTAGAGPRGAGLRGSKAIIIIDKTVII